MALMVTPARLWALPFRDAVRHRIFTAAPAWGASPLPEEGKIYGLEKLDKMGKRRPLMELLGPKGPMDTPEMLWVLGLLWEHRELARTYALWCARQVQLLGSPALERILDVGDAFVRGDASDDELEDASDWAHRLSCRESWSHEQHAASAAYIATFMPNHYEWVRAPGTSVSPGKMHKKAFPLLAAAEASDRARWSAWGAMQTHRRGEITLEGEQVARLEQEEQLAPTRVSKHDKLRAILEAGEWVD